MQEVKFEQKAGIAVFPGGVAHYVPGPDKRSMVSSAVRKPESSRVKPQFRAIQDKVQKGETLLAIFEKYGLDVKELFAMRDVAAKVHPLKSLHPGQPYTLTVDCQSRVSSFVYWINRDSYLKIQKVATGFQAEKNELAYEKKLLTLSGAIEDNLISSIGEDREHLVLALDLSDIFAWDIDFASDLRKGDTFRIITEGYLLQRGIPKIREYRCRRVHE